MKEIFPSSSGPAVCQDLLLKENTRLVPRNGSPARRPRIRMGGRTRPWSCPLKVPSFASYSWFSNHRGKAAVCVCIQRLKRCGWPSIHAGCGSPILCGISAVNKSRLLSHRNAYGGRRGRHGLERSPGTPEAHPNNTPGLERCKREPTPNRFSVWDEDRSEGTTVHSHRSQIPDFKMSFRYCVGNLTSLARIDAPFVKSQVPNPC